MSDNEHLELEALYREWSERIEVIERLNRGETALTDQAIADLLEIERAIMAQPAGTRRALAMKVIVATREEGSPLGENMTALIDEARFLLSH